MATRTIVIIGAGQAGAQAAFTLREHGFDGRIFLLGEEAQAPYQRPPLSKAFLERMVSVERLLLRPVSFYAANSIDLRLHTRVKSIEREARRVRLLDGGTLAYDKLLLATGSRPRTLDLPGSRHSDVHYLNSVQDALRLRAKISADRHIVVVGGGYIGLEVAAVANVLGARVTVLEREDRLLSRVTSPGISDFFAEAHRARGVSIHYAADVTAFSGGERLEAVVCKHGPVQAELALIGIGAEPNVELAQDAGLACNDGIVVDEYCRTADPHIYAAGDCTNHWNAALGQRTRLESVPNAVSQGTIAAVNILEKPTAYAEVPWFWSHQYQYKLQTAGCSAGYDEIEERGDLDSGSFALVYRRGGRITAVDAVNLPREYMAVRKELAAQCGRERMSEVHGAHTTAVQQLA